MGGLVKEKVVFMVAILLGSVFGQTSAKTFALRCGGLFDGRSESLRKNVVVVVEGEAAGGGESGGEDAQLEAGGVLDDGAVDEGGLLDEGGAVDAPAGEGQGGQGHDG